MSATAVESALAAWVRSATGLAIGKVIWSGQGGRRPTGTFAVLRLAPLAPVGQDWVEVLDNPGGGTGEEIEHRVRGTRRASFEIQVFDGDALGAASAAALLNKVVAHARLPTRRQELTDAGVGILQFGTVQRIDGVVGSSEFEPRAVLEVVLHLSEEASELGTYIQKVELENQTTGGSTQVVDLESSP